MKTDTLKTKQESLTSIGLRQADILLIHTKHNAWARLIRWATHCYWNHALLVFSVEGENRQGPDPLVVDAKTDGRIALKRADFYFGHPEKFDIAVKRFDQAWFQNGSEVLNIRDSIARAAAAEIDWKPSPAPIELARRLWRQLTLILRFARRKIFGRPKPPELSWNLRLKDFKAVTCSGFVQWCYYRAVASLIEKNDLSAARQREVIFFNKRQNEVTPYDLLTATPADLATSQKLAWKYVIRNGRMTETSVCQEAVVC